MKKEVCPNGIGQNNTVIKLTFEECKSKCQMSHLLTTIATFWILKGINHSYFAYQRPTKTFS